MTDRQRGACWCSLWAVVFFGLVVGMVLAFNVGSKMNYRVQEHFVKAHPLRAEAMPAGSQARQMAEVVQFAEMYYLSPSSFVLLCFALPILVAGILLMRSGKSRTPAESRVRGWQLAAFAVFWVGACWGLAKGLGFFPKAPLLPVGFYIGAGVYLAASILLVALAYGRRERWAHAALAAVILGLAFTGWVKFKAPEMLRFPSPPQGPSMMAAHMP